MSSVEMAEAHDDSTTSSSADAAAAAAAGISSNVVNVHKVTCLIPVIVIWPINNDLS